MATITAILGYCILILAAWVTVIMVRGLFSDRSKPNSGLVYLAIPLWLVGLALIGIFN